MGHRKDCIDRAFAMVELIEGKGVKGFTVIDVQLALNVSRSAAYYWLAAACCTYPIYQIDSRSDGGPGRPMAVYGLLV
jgi:hypothetical protein